MHYRFISFHGVRAALAPFLLAFLVTGLAAAQDKDNDDRVLWRAGDISQVLSDADDAASRASTILSRIQNGFEKVQGINLDATIQEALDDLQTQIQAARAGRAEFLGNDCDSGSPCGRFRSDLVALFRGLSNTNTALLKAAPVTVETDFEHLVTLVENAPGRVLFPVHRAFQQAAIIGDGVIADRLADLAVQVEFLALALQDADAAAKSNGLNLDACAFLLDNPAEADVAIRGATGFGIFFIAAGYALIASGETHLEGKAGVHGYPGIIVKNNLRKKFGNGLVGLGKAVGALASAVSDKQRYCTMLEFQEGVIANQMMILANQEKIWNALPPGWTRGEEILVPEAP